MSTQPAGDVIDARGLKLVPALSPKVLDESGNVIYNSEYLEKASLEEHGVVSYFRDFENAKKNKRVSGNPLVLKALKLAEGSKTDIVLSNADAEQLRDPGSNLKYLAAGKVVVVTD